MALVVILFLVVFFFTVLLGYALFFKNSSALLKIAIIFIIVFLTIVTLTFKAVLTDLESFEDYDKLGPFGDYVGGVLNPLISGFAVFAAGFAFYAQYQANKQVQKQFEIQKFDSQFYERLRLVKEDVNNIYLPLRTGDTLNGRKVYYELDKEIKFIYFIVSARFKNLEKSLIFKLSYNIFYEGRKNFFSISSINRISSIYDISKADLLILEDMFAEVYKSFVDLEEENNLKTPIDDDKQREFADKFVSSISQKGELDRFDEFISEIVVNNTTHLLYSVFNNEYEISLNHLPFKGMQSKLSLIFRQIFSLVKFVASNKIFSYEEKRNYLRILRSILSNYEQIHIFYNWYSGIGLDWEKGNNKFLTDFRMIHNIPPSFLIEGIALEKIFDVHSEFRKEVGRDFDSLFEYQDLKNGI